MRAQFEKVTPHLGSSLFCWRRRLRRIENRYHFHPEFEIVLVLSGAGRRLIGDNLEEFGAGDLVLVGPNLPHMYFELDAKLPPRRLPRKEIVVFQFPPDIVPGAGSAGLPEMRLLESLLARAGCGLAFAVSETDRIRSLLTEASNASGWLRLVRVLEALFLLAAAKSVRPLASPTYRPELRLYESERINRVFAFLHEHFDTTAPLAEAARLAGLSPSAFSRFFHRSAGRSYRHYLADLRIGHAAKLLLETDWSITRIALACGFNNVSAFNRLFRKTRGCTPSSLRRCSRPSA